MRTICPGSHRLDYVQRGHGLPHRVQHLLPGGRARPVYNLHAESQGLRSNAVNLVHHHRDNSDHDAVLLLRVGALPTLVTKKPDLEPQKGE